MKCSKCEGTGYIVSRGDKDAYFDEEWMLCNTCSGSGSNSKALKFVKEPESLPEASKTSPRRPSAKVPGGLDSQRKVGTVKREWRNVVMSRTNDGQYHLATFLALPTLFPLGNIYTIEFSKDGKDITYYGVRSEPYDYDNDYVIVRVDQAISCEIRSSKNAE